MTVNRWLKSSSFLSSTTHCVHCKHIKHEQGQGLQGSLTWAESGARATAAALFTLWVRESWGWYMGQMLSVNSTRVGLLQSRPGLWYHKEIRTAHQVFCMLCLWSSLLYTKLDLWEKLWASWRTVVDKNVIVFDIQLKSHYFYTNFFCIYGWCRNRGSCIVCYY